MQHHNSNELKKTTTKIFNQSVCQGGQYSKTRECCVGTAMNLIVFVRSDGKKKEKKKRKRKKEEKNNDDTTSTADQAVRQ